MSDNSKINWCDSTWNITSGCTKVSAGCKNCYAERIANRFWGNQEIRTGDRAFVNGYYLYLTRQRKFTDVQCHPERLDIPLHWRKPRRVFVDSMSDLFHELIGTYFIAKVFAIATIAKQHQYIILTKRPRRMQSIFEDSNLRFDCEVELWQEQLCRERGYCPQDFEWPLPNVWIGPSISTQEDADKNIPIVLQTPAALRFVSVEPMLEKIMLWRGLDNPQGSRQMLIDCIDWVICGCESGPGARPMSLDWARSLRDQCVTAGVPFFLKQMMVDGKLIKMPELDGRVWDQYPQEHKEKLDLERRFK